MDTGLLNLGEEHFPTCYVFEEDEGQESNSADNNKSYFNEWEDEREINGDIALIPESSNFCESFNDMTNSPPSLLFQKMIDWSAFIYVEGADGLIHEATTPHPLPYQEELGAQLDKDLKNFDIASYIDEPEPPSKKVRAAVKKIDVEAQKYIVEEDKAESSTDDVVDVETVDGASLPVLEASDAFSLLEQFEASEKPNFTSNNKSSNFQFSDSLNNIEILDKVPKTPVDIFEEEKGDIKGEKTEQKSVLPSKVDEARKTPAKQTSDYVKNKQILDALPQELIQRINESGKRKTITVIPPIPNKKRGASRSLDNSSQVRSKVLKLANSERVHFDHDYCASISPYPKEPQKDSGFQSSEEDDRSVIRNQPTVKTADGKLMVSLLKVNTIRNNNNNQKKKLNLEEYKKRRFINSAATSQSSSPISSTCSSPLPEDENLKRLKHQEKLMKMAADLLNTPAKSSQKTLQKIEEPPKIVVEAPTQIVPPPDLEVKTYLSIGTNTDVSSISNRKNLLASAQELEEIKPLLQKVSDKINSNSFITSLIENIPKVKKIATTPVKTDIVPEDKIIHYLKKDREPVKTHSVGTQTHFDIVDDDVDSRYRRRLEAHRSPSSSSSSSSSSSGYRRRRSTSSSRSRRSNSSSSHSSRVSSRSRSRSKSPTKKQRQYSAERIREVEERRVIYVGRIARGTVKEDLQRRFQAFGIITNISLHFRDYGDNYGFVTFANKEDAYEAVEHGNDGHAYPKYDLSFGGRRLFCKTSYSDLDNMREDDYNYYQSSRGAENTFDALLRAAQEKIRKRKP